MGEGHNISKAMFVFWWVGEVEGGPIKKETSSQIIQGIGSKDILLKTYSFIYLWKL
jgi:hypothetical protein